MPQTISYLEAVVGADITSFRRAMAEVRSDLTGMSTGIGQSLKNVGRDLTYALTVPLVAAGAASAKLAMDFDASARNIASISTDYAANFDEYNRRILEFGATTQAGSRAAIDALYEIYSAGVLNFAQAEAIMQVSVATAEAGVADLTATTKGLTTAMLAFGAANDTAFGGDFQVAADYFSNVLTRTVQLGVGSMDMFVTSIGRAGAAAATSGASYLDLGAAMAYLTQRGLTTYNAGTALNNLFNKMISPTDRMRQSFQQLGVTTSNELFEKFGDLGGVMEALYSTVGDNTEAWGEMFNTIQGKRAAFAIFEDISAYKDYLVEFNTDLDNATSSARAEQLKSFSAQVKLMGSALETLGIQVGQAILPILTPLVQGFTDLFTSLQNSNPFVMELVVGIGLLVAAIGPLTWLVGALLNPMGLFLAAVAGIVAVIGTDFNGIGTTIVDAVNTALPSLRTLVDAVSEFVRLIVQPGALLDLEGMLPAGEWYAGTSPLGIRSNMYDQAPYTGLGSLVDQSTGATNGYVSRNIPGGDGSNQYFDWQERGFNAFQTPNDNSLQGRIGRAWAQVGGFITNAIEDTLRDVGDWVQTGGAHLLGLIVGNIAIGLVSAAAAIFRGIGSVLGMGGEAGSFASEFGTHFSEGIQDALKNADIDPNSFEGIVDNVVAAILTAFLTYKFVISKLPMGGFVGKLFTTIGKSIAASISVKSILSTLAHALLAVVTSGLTWAIALGVITGTAIFSLMSKETQDTIGQAVLDFYGLIVTGSMEGGQDLAEWRTGAEESLLYFFAGVFDFLGNEALGAQLRVRAAELGAKLRDPVKQGLIDGLSSRIKGGGSIQGSDIAALALDFGSIYSMMELDGIVNGDYSADGVWGNTPFQEGGFGYDTTNYDPLVDGVVGNILRQFDTARGLIIQRVNEQLTLDRTGGVATLPGGTERPALFQGVLDNLTGEATPEAMLTHLNGFVTNLRDSFMAAVQRARSAIELSITTEEADKWSSITDGLIGRQGKATSGNSGILAPVLDSFDEGFAGIKTKISTGAVDIETNFAVIPPAIQASADGVVDPLSAFNLNMASGMSNLLLTVVTFADSIIAKWNEMLATLGVAPVVGGSAITGAGAGGGTVAVNNVNMYVTTNDPNTINNAFKKQGINLQTGKGK